MTTWLNTLGIWLALTLPAAVGMAQPRGREVSWVNPDIPEMTGLVHKVLASKSLGHDVGYVAWTPPGFDADGQTRYPVVYFLHGAGGSEKPDSAGFSGHVAAAIRAKKMPPVICVYPNGGMSGYRGDVESMIIDELIPLIDKSQLYPSSPRCSSAIAARSGLRQGSVAVGQKDKLLGCRAGTQCVRQPVNPRGLRPRWILSTTCSVATPTTTRAG